MPPFADCETCSSYARRRQHVIFPAVKRIAAKHGVTNVAYLAAQFFTAVHERHLSGMAL